MQQIHRYKGTTKFMFLSTDYSGLSSTITFCPPYDFRSVPLLQTYNAIVRNLASEFRLPYLDLIHIAGPMWDSAEDYCHPSGAVFRAELDWILHHIFAAAAAGTPLPVESPKLPAPLPSGAPRPVKPEHYRLVRPSEQQTVFLVVEGTGRAFPNERTFLKMGFKFVASGPLVRSSYKASDFLDYVEAKV